MIYQGASLVCCRQFCVAISTLVACAGLVASSARAEEPIVPGRTAIGADPSPADGIAADRQQDQGDAGATNVSVLVHLQSAADRNPIRQFAAANGGRVFYEYNILPNVVNIRGIPAAKVNALQAVQGVMRIEEDRTVHAHMNDSTPLIRALQSQISAAGFSADGSGVRVCIIDSGIDSDSAMYASRIDFAAGRDFVNNDNDPEDDAGHGSHVAGTAVGGDSLTVNFGCVGTEPFHGVAPQATLIGLKALDASGNGSFSDVIAAIDYGADQSPSGGRCDVINLSLGGGAFSGNCDGDSGAAAANNAVDAGVVVVASSGNEANNNAMGTPACGSKVIAVGATYDDTYPNCEFPNQTTFEFCTCVNIFCCGTCTDNSPSVDQITCMSNRSTTLDVTAPGCITFSADKDASPNGIVGLCGTSMASPHVAGLAALLLSADPTLTPAEVRQAIRDGAIDLGASGFDTIYGFGRIDALNSLALVSTTCTIDSDCDDGDACTTDVCNAGACSNTPVGCVDGDGCCPAGCDNTTDNDCPAFVCGNGTCEAGEDCGTCPADCFTGSGASCGNDICEAGDGEDCVICPEDCNGVQSGKPSNRFCCGDGDGQNPLGCGSPQCTGNGNTCTDVPAQASCCGDFVCEGTEDSFNCSVDCGDPPFCGDGTCDPGEDSCNCAADCGAPPSTESNCTDGVDEDCDGGADCNDPTGECDSHPSCQPPACDNDGICEPGEDCNNCSSDCDSKLNGNPAGRYCCGNGVLEGPEGDGRCDGNP